MSTVADWNRLYQASIEFKNLRPWDFITERQVFAVQDQKQI